MDDREQYTTFRIKAPKGWFLVSEAPSDMKLYDMNVLTPFIDLEQDPEHFIWIHKYNLMYDEPTPEPWLRDYFFRKL